MSAAAISYFASNPSPTLEIYAQRYGGMMHYGYKGLSVSFRDPDGAKGFIDAVRGYYPGAVFSFKAPKVSKRTGGRHETQGGSYSFTFPGLTPGTVEPQTMAPGWERFFPGQAFSPNPPASPEGQELSKHSDYFDSEMREQVGTGDLPRHAQEVLNVITSQFGEAEFTLQSLIDHSVGHITGNRGKTFKLGAVPHAVTQALKVLHREKLVKDLGASMVPGEHGVQKFQVTAGGKGKSLAVAHESAEDYAEKALAAEIAKRESKPEGYLDLPIAEPQTAQQALAPSTAGDTSFDVAEFGQAAGSVGTKKHAHTGHPLSGAIYRPVIRKKDLGPDGKPILRLADQMQQRIRATGYKVRSNPIQNPIPFGAEIAGGIAAGVALASTNAALKRAGVRNPMGRRKPNPLLAVVGAGLNPGRQCYYCGAGMGSQDEVCRMCWAGQAENPSLAVVGANPGPSWPSPWKGACKLCGKPAYHEVEYAGDPHVYFLCGNKACWRLVSKPGWSIPKRRHNPACNGCGDPSHRRSNGFFSKLVGESKTPRARLITDKGKKRTITLAQARQIAIRDGQLDNFEASLAAYKKFWGVAPKRVIDHHYDDGRPGTINEFGAGLGTVPETVYAGVPKGSFKREKGKTITYVHKHARGGEPHEVVIPRMGFTVKVGGKSTIGEWWDEVKHRRH